MEVFGDMEEILTRSFLLCSNDKQSNVDLFQIWNNNVGINVTDTSDNVSYIFQINKRAHAPPSNAKTDILAGILRKTQGL